ncbi:MULTISPECIES: HpcH/HpaI aldolase/citrate lyase family protein [unclassified Mesorhizobium]|uniref:HpcH/HpaI aldolase/citrate lyase family protein n=1 Tax=unclassified Mesorhizobium TaxID=325217 RepID=UPI00301551C0
MTGQPKRLRRCQLAVPGSSDKMMVKAAGMEVDHIFLDLEDAVAPAAKVPARAQIINALNTLDFGSSVRCVRINDLDTHYAYEDIISVVEGAGANLDTILVPKVKSACDVRFVDRLLTQIETKMGFQRRIGIEVLIEEAEAIMRVEEIAGASDRLEALIFGMGDYSASQGIDPRAISGDSGYPGDIWHYARYKMIVAAKTYGLDAVDGPFVNFRDGDWFRTECVRALQLGAAGKWAIHPSQVEIAQDVFSPSQVEVDRAYKAVSAYRQAQEQGLGAIQVDGQMVDVATVRLVQRIIDRAELAGMKPSVGI